MEIKFTELNSANVKATNVEDTAKVYDVTANVNISNNSVNNVDSGNVTLEGVHKASFTMYNEGNLNITFIGLTSDEKCSVTIAIDEFIEACKNATSTITI